MQTATNVVLVGILLVGLALTGVATALEVGDKAPDFKLPSTMGGEVSLSQFREKNSFSSNSTVLISHRCDQRTCRPGWPITASSRL
jgi:peroxiredoxin